MRLLHVIPTLNPTYGGPLEAMKTSCRHIARMGIDNEVLTLDPPDSHHLDYTEIPVHGLGPAYTRWAYAPRLRAWLEQNHRRFDAVILHVIWKYPIYVAWSVLRKTATPYYVFIHGSLDPWFKRRYPHKHLIKWLFWPWGPYRALRDARAVLFTAEQEKELARKTFWPYRCNEIVVTLGTEPPATDTRQQLREFFTEFPELQDKRLLVFLGRIDPKKGCDLLLRAFAEVADGESNLHLLMVGPDAKGMEPRLRRLATSLGIAERVTWAGMRTGNVKWGAFRAADAFVLPSHTENFGIAVVESLACGCPVLISDKINIWREVKSDGGGLVEPDTQEGTNRLLRRWLTMSPMARDEMRAAAVRCFDKRFHARAAAQDLVRVVLPDALVDRY